MARRYFNLVLAVIASTTAMLAVHSAAAQGILMPDNARLPDGIRRPGGPFHGPSYIQPFYVKNLKVTTSINDAVAETTVEQTFVNASSFQQEATYLYPLPAGANPTGFSMTIGDKTMEPRILAKDEANSIFEGYVRRFRDPALLEYVGRSLVKMSVFPIPAQGERTIRMRYTEVLKPENGVRKYVYPLSTSRFGSKPVGVATVSIKLSTSSPIKNVYSPSHDLSVRHTEEERATASWESVNESSDKDLTLFFSTSSDEVGLSLLTYKSGDRDGYFMLLASPRVTVPRERILPKSIVFVLDRTGSMAGPKIEQARKSLLYCLNSLHAADKFDLITFNESPDILYKKLVPASAENIAKARRFIENIEAAGGTNIDEALRAATSLLHEEAGTGKMIVFLTDGLPTVGEQNIDTILKHFKQWNQPVAVQQRQRSGVRLADYASASSEPARIFCFGLGFDVNVPFLDRLADLGRGDSDYIKPEEDVEARVSSFFAKVESPVLSNIAVTYDGIETYDIFPKTLPDMFKGSQVVIAGRFRGNGAGAIALTGMANGADERFKLAVKSTEADGMNTFVPRIWAQRKLGYLIDQVRLAANPAGQTELLDEIIRLSKEYGIITEYTSFLVDEQEQRRLGILPGSAGGSAVPGHTAIQRREVAQRAVQYGISGLNVTDQSGRAKDLKGSDKAASRYQSSNGSVDLYSTNGFTGPGGAAQGQASAGNFKYSGAIGGLGGRPAQGPAAGKPSLSVVLGANDAGNAITMQNAGGHTFYRQAHSVWVDDSYAAGKQNVIKIQAYSDAHFDLLHRLPELAVYSSVGDHVIMRVNNCAIEIGDEGKTKLTDADVKLIMAR